VDLGKALQDLLAAQVTQVQKDEPVDTSARETTSREASSIILGAYFSMNRPPVELSR